MATYVIFRGDVPGPLFHHFGLPGAEPNDPAHMRAIRSFDDHGNRFVANTDYADERNSRIEIQHALWIAMDVLAVRTMRILKR